MHEYQIGRIYEIHILDTHNLDISSMKLLSIARLNSSERKRCLAFQRMGICYYWHCNFKTREEKLQFISGSFSMCQFSAKNDIQVNSFSLFILKYILRKISITKVRRSITVSDYFQLLLFISNLLLHVLSIIV